MSAASIPLLTASDVRDLLSPADAVESVTSALRGGLDVESDSPRLFSPLRSGEFLLMPTETAHHAGIKVVTIAPENPAHDLPKIQAWYLLFGADALEPQAILEGAELTLLRTPAVTVAAIREILAADPRGPKTEVEHLAIFGSGPQTEAHIRTLAAVLPVHRVTVIGRTPKRVDTLIERLADLAASGLAITAGTPDDARAADVIITATSSSDPVIDIEHVAPNAVVAAIGAHGLTHRELGADLVRAAHLVVESRASALQESGTLLEARPESDWRAGTQPLTNLRELVQNGLTRDAERPAVYIACGMSWEDLVLVEQIMRNHGARSGTDEEIVDE